MDGWAEVVPGDSHDPLRPEELRAYFDGAEPGWRHAQAPGHQIPRRQVVAEAVARLDAASGQTMVLLVGPAGQGRSTAVRQAAVDLAERGHRVLFRTRGAGLDGPTVAALPAGPVYVLVSDDAEEVSAGLEAGVEALCRAGRRDVHWLLTARDDDWRDAFRGDGRGVEPSWDRLIELWPARGARTTTLAVTAEDAASIVDAWGTVATADDRLGADGLGDAAGRQLADELTAADDLLGASLALRHGPDGLSAHVRAALDWLPAGVVRAFRYAAVAGAVRVDDVDLAALAGLAGVGGVAIAEALAFAGLASATSAGVLRVRHPAIARAGFALVDEADLAPLFVDLVRAGAGRAVMTCAPTLAGRLQELGVDRARADQVACACADAAATMSDRLLLTIAHAVTYRRAGRTAEAAELLRAPLASAAGAGDWATLGRQYLLELSQAQADTGDHDEAVGLAALALADLGGLDRPTTTDVKLALAHLGNLCMQLDEHQLEPRHLRLLQVTAHLGPRFTPKWDQRARSDFRRFGVYADDAGVPACPLADAFAWLADEVERTVTAPLAGLLVAGPLATAGAGPPGLHQLQATLGAIATH